MDYGDIIFNIGSDSVPTNRNPAYEDSAMEYITDLVDCCGTELGSPVRAQHGD